MPSSTWLDSRSPGITATLTWLELGFLDNISRSTLCWILTASRCIVIWTDGSADALTAHEALNHSYDVVFGMAYCPVKESAGEVYCKSDSCKHCF
jgi:hypothetical protein